MNADASGDEEQFESLLTDYDEAIARGAAADQASGSVL